MSVDQRQYAAYTGLPDEALCALAKAGERDAEEVLVKRYHRLVRKLSRPYYLAGGDNDDLIQEGMIGLMHAVREYDAGKAAGSRTFAEIWFLLRYPSLTVITLSSARRRWPR